MQNDRSSGSRRGGKATTTTAPSTGGTTSVPGMPGYSITLEQRDGNGGTLNGPNNLSFPFTGNFQNYDTSPMHAWCLGMTPTTTLGPVLTTVRKRADRAKE